MTAARDVEHIDLEECAGTVVWLCSKMSLDVTGATVPVMVARGHPAVGCAAREADGRSIPDGAGVRSWTRRFCCGDHIHHDSQARGAAGGGPLVARGGATAGVRRVLLGFRRGSRSVGLLP